MTERLPFHFHAWEKEMATHSSVLAWRIPGTGEPGGLPSVGQGHGVAGQHDLIRIGPVFSVIIFSCENIVFKVICTSVKAMSAVADLLVQFELVVL